MQQLLYYEAEAGHFGVRISICFSDEAFQQALKDAKITTKHSSLDVGIAESHYIEQEGTLNVLLAIVFNYEEIKKLSALDRLGIIYHEVSHTVTHVFQYIGEDEAKIGDESRAYLGEYLFKQVVSIYTTEDKIRGDARKRNRKLSNQTDQAIIGALLQMAQHNNGSAGSDSGSEQTDLSSGTESTQGSFITSPTPRIC